MKDQPSNVSRRKFLFNSCLVVGVALAPKGLREAVAAENPAAKAVSGSGVKALNAFIVIAPDDTVTVISKHIEFGQGPYTGLATLAAEELNADWNKIRVESAPANAEVYGNLKLGGMQITGGSSAIANSYTQMREAAATAREMLVAAAAAAWSVPASQITVENGRIRHAASGRDAGFGQFVEAASKMQAPEKVKLKDPKDFIFIGKDRPKVDTLAKTNGEAKFTLDIKEQNMLYATVIHPSQYGATVKSFDAKEALKIEGVVDVKAISQGVVVFAEHTYASLKGRNAVKVQWDTSKAETRSSDELLKHYKTFVDKKGAVATDNGDVEKVLNDKNLVAHEVEFVFPFLAHAPMEPLDAVLKRNANGGIDCYAGAQSPVFDKQAISEVCGVDLEKVNVHVQLTGGSFGRRAQNNSPFMREAAEVFKVSGMKRPVKFFWTREDDIRGGYYRPLYVHKLKGVMDKKGNIVGWDQTVVGQSIMGKKKGQTDNSSVEGASDLPYKIPNLRLTSHNIEGVGVPPLWWRSVGHTHTAFTVEVFIDELLEKSGKDPIEGRLALLKEHPRETGVLRKVAQMSASAGKVPQGRARGVAVHKSFNSYVAQIAEVSRKEDGTPHVHRVWVAVDCGVAVNPNVVAAQMEGCVGYGLGAILHNEVTLGANGEIEQSNFHDYISLRMSEMPQVEVAIIDSTEAPTGVGEPGLPPLGPAVVNAWRRLTGQAIHELPMNKTIKTGSV